MGKKLFENYIIADAPMELNLSHKLRVACKEAYDKQQFDDSLFKDIEGTRFSEILTKTEEVKQILFADSLARFYCSEEYKSKFNIKRPALQHSKSTDSYVTFKEQIHTDPRNRSKTSQRRLSKESVLPVAPFQSKGVIKFFKETFFPKEKTASPKQ